VRQVESIRGNSSFLRTFKNAVTSPQVYWRKVTFDYMSKPEKAHLSSSLAIEANTGYNHFLVTIAPRKGDLDQDWILLIHQLDRVL